MILSRIVSNQSIRFVTDKVTIYRTKNVYSGSIKCGTKARSLQKATVMCVAVEWLRYVITNINTEAHQSHYFLTNNIPQTYNLGKVAVRC